MSATTTSSCRRFWSRLAAKSLPSAPARAASSSAGTEPRATGSGRPRWASTRTTPARSPTTPFPCVRACSAASRPRWRPTAARCSLPSSTSCVPGSADGYGHSPRSTSRRPEASCRARPRLRATGLDREVAIGHVRLRDRRRRRRLHLDARREAVCPRYETTAPASGRRNSRGHQLVPGACRQHAVRRRRGIADKGDSLELDAFTT